MNKTVSITLTIPVTQDVLKLLVQKNALDRKLKGTAHAVDEQTIKIVVMGAVNDIDDYIDSLYEGYKKHRPLAVDVEPGHVEHDYRGTFRIIE
jgi:acylphosphatase